MQTRKVYCGVLKPKTTEGSGDGGSGDGTVSTIEVLDNSECLAERKYEETVECDGADEECVIGSWYVSLWSECSATECGGESGTQTRKVFCIMNDTQVSPSECGDESMPDETQPCEASCPLEEEASGSGSSGSGNEAEPADGKRYVKKPYY